MVLDRIARWGDLGVDDQGYESHDSHEEDDARQVDQVVEVVGVEVADPFPCTGWRDGSNILQKLFEGLHLGLVLSASRIVDKMLLPSERTASFYLGAYPMAVR